MKDFLLNFKESFGLHESDKVGIRLPVICYPAIIMDVSKVTLDRKILISIICIIASIEVAVFLNFHSWKEQIPLSLLTLLLLIPTWAACKYIKLLLNKDKGWAEYSAELEKHIKKLEEETKEFKNLINGIDAFVFSYETAERKWFLLKDS